MLHFIKNNYYISSFFWSTLAKILTALVGFISVPLLLGIYGKADYGLLSIATAFNGYMHLLDLGMNTGAVKYYSQWKAEGNHELVFRVARTNLTFYLAISFVNILLLILVAYCGENLFSITHIQFLTLRTCLFIIAFFSIFNWLTTVFNQLLIADRQLAFTMQVQCVQSVIKAFLIFIVLYFHLSLSWYFFFLTMVISFAIIPYTVKSYKSLLIDSLLPATYWNDFRIVIKFSLSIFALSLFQVTATQSRPLILGILADNGANAVADFRILEVIPQLIIMIGGTFSGIFLPRAAELVVNHDQKAIDSFAYKWTSLTTIVICILCFPFILCSSEVLSAYVGSQYENLSKWLILWCYTVLLQMHATPSYSLIIASGRTKKLVIVTAVSCLISIVINIFLCPIYSVGSAVIGYFVYVILLMFMYYLFFYKRYLQIDRFKVLKSFCLPFGVALCVYFVIQFIPMNNFFMSFFDFRLANILMCIFKTVLWLLPYILCLFIFKIVSLDNLK